jgi:hypothetical protein
MYPAPNAQGVPLNPSIVLEVSDFSSLDPLLATNDDSSAFAVPVQELDGGTSTVVPGLYDASGQRIELRELRRFEFQDRCIDGYSLLIPKTELTPETDYVIDRGPFSPNRFRTGSTSRSDPDKGRVNAFKYHVAGTLGKPALISKIFVEYDTAEPLFFVLGGTSGTTVTFTDQNPGPIGLAVDPTSCVDVDVVGLSGGSLQAKRFCEPDRCTAPMLQQACFGDYDALTLQQFENLAASGTCETEGASAKGAADASDENSGCALLPTPRHIGVQFFFVTGVLLYSGHRRRQRTPR